MLATKLNNINDNINKIGKITGFKKRIVEYEKLTSELEEFSNYLLQIEDTVNNISIPESTIEISDEEYYTNIQYLKEVMKIFDNVDNIEDQIDLYKEILKKIKDVEKYLENRKMEIQTIS